MMNATSSPFLLYVRSRQLILSKSLPSVDSICTDSSTSLDTVPVVPIQHRGSMIMGIGFDYSDFFIYYTTADAVWRREADSNKSQAELGESPTMVTVNLVGKGNISQMYYRYSK